MNSEIYSIQEIASLIGEGDNHLDQPHQIIHHILTDSRKVTDASSSVFFVLKGSKDAHQFIPTLYQAGVKAFIYYQKDFNINDFPEANFIYVNDTLHALQQLAAHHRSKFNYPVIGITGSNGKTIVKEWLFQLLAPDYHVVRSPKSYNSQIGVPLAVWQMDKQYDFAVFEAGLSLPHEMAKLQNIIKPDIGILTNIGSPHDEGFKNRTEKIKEKFELFKEVKLLICNQEYVSFKASQVNVFTWSFSEHADLRIKNQTIIDQHTCLNCTYQQEDFDIQIPFTDKASIENAITCLATLLALKVSIPVISIRLARLHQVKMRLELKSGINQTSIIDDSYNSDVSSLEIALDFLNQQNQHPVKTLILSDIQQSGLKSEVLYSKVAKLLKAKHIDKLIAIGPQLTSFKTLFNTSSQFFLDTDTFIEHYNLDSFNNETILLKGARQFEFEKISKILTQKVHETILEINLNALEQNLNYYKSKLQPGVKLMAMVKAFAYGSGSYEIANLLQYNKVDYLAVAYADEGIALRQAGITLPIMVMSPEVSSFEAIVKYNLEPEIFSFTALSSLHQYLKTLNKTQYPIHLKLDTGMHRLGFEEKDLSAIKSFLLDNDTVKIKTVFSHLAASEAPQHDDYTKSQIHKFDSFCKNLEAEIGYTFIKHICNTSAIRRWPKAQFDMVRLGIGLYGIDNLSKDDVSLHQVATLKTTVSQIKELKKGDTIGYGRVGVMQQDGKIATVKIGYADGYPRALGKGLGSMFINNQEVFTIGNICMDMCMLDITDKDVKEGDEVIIFDSQPQLYKMAEQLHTIPYEVLTNISQRVKRVYYYE
ncbi:bifunctional UDP-N-acetylmuramoyl-tripeptide:D-alanyl-D-alanine ligase/alanine racemase [Pedobacter glucosidilyticus]|uniref:bifunctional UDP-N-acetylmuramoyl-tripeptide:D-alanyl-D-alanine ligase/alanine racemase n=1 Tax=Pedobacter glucosidilyticus TaxID=1122941 RepID=UPI0026EB0F4D|nr:bifunctional UDP-N-acetylmuramoyl-tripeptide:D-alanyl-D-alanine ligase/alanine racemase [Pedobacter glucosidilyticus]